jgi:hypothetical protein
MNDENRNDWIKRMAGLLCNMNDNKIDLRLHPNGALKLHQAGNWTEKEIHELKQLVQDKLESQNELPKAAWEEIAGHFPRFSAEQCKYYYLSHIKVPNRRKGAWSEQEDELLKSLVKEHGTSWSIIAEKFPNRNQLQCSYRWHRVLKYSDAIKSGRLTDQEKLLIKEGVLMFGNNWEAIRTTYLPHRTPIQCMRWWNFQLRKSDTVDDEDISIKPEMNRWTDDEDKILSFVVSGYQDDAEISWSKVANMVPGRNAAQCRTRWLYSLKPDVGKRWTYDEGMQLLEIVHKLKLTDLKNIWPTVSKELNTGRDDWQCRRKYNYMLRTGNRFAV